MYSFITVSGMAMQLVGGLEDRQINSFNCYSNLLSSYVHTVMSLACVD